MGKTLHNLWSRHRLLLIGFTSALALTLFFGVKAALFALYWNDPANRNQTIQDWMTVRYVANSWRVPPGVIIDALSSPPERNGRPVRMGDIAASEGLSIEDLRTLLNTTIEAHKAERSAR